MLRAGIGAAIGLSGLRSMAALAANTSSVTALGERLHLGTPVTEIRRDADGVDLRTADDTLFSLDNNTNKQFVRGRTGTDFENQQNGGEIGFQRWGICPGRDSPKDDQRNDAQPPFATPPEKSVHSSSRGV